MRSRSSHRRSRQIVPLHQHFRTSARFQFFLPDLSNSSIAARAGGLILERAASPTHDGVHEPENCFFVGPVVLCSRSSILDEGIALCRCAGLRASCHRTQFGRGRYQSFPEGRTSLGLLARPYQAGDFGVGKPQVGCVTSGFRQQPWVAQPPHVVARRRIAGIFQCSHVAVNRLPASAEPPGELMNGGLATLQQRAQDAQNTHYVAFPTFARYGRHFFEYRHRNSPL